MYGRTCSDVTSARDSVVGQDFQRAFGVRAGLDVYCEAVIEMVTVALLPGVPGDLTPLEVGTTGRPASGSSTPASSIGVSKESENGCSGCRSECHPSETGHPVARASAAGVSMGGCVGFSIVLGLVSVTLYACSIPVMVSVRPSSVDDAPLTPVEHHVAHLEWPVGKRCGQLGRAVLI